MASQSTENPQSPKTPAVVTKVIKSESFIEKALLLVLTAAISGLVIPFIANSIQEQKLKKGAIVQAQSKLLEDLTNTILTYETLALDVSWYKSNELVENNEKHRHAFDKYSDRIVDLWAQWRSEMVKSKTLTSKSISDTLANFFRRVQLQQDGPLTALCQKQNATVADWQAMHNVSKNIATDASQLMEKLAGDLNLTRNDMK